MTSTGPPLVIKLPSQTEQIGVKNSLPLEPPEKSNDSSVEEEDEEDDWDTFQSFPASGNETVPVPDRSPSISGYNSGEDGDEKGHEESLNIKDHEFGEAVSNSYIVDGNNQTEDFPIPEDDASNHQQSAEALPGADEELLLNIQSDQIGGEHTEPSDMISNNESSQPVLYVQRTDSTESYDDLSDEQRTGTSETYDQGSQPTELSGEHAESSSELPECTDSRESYDNLSDENHIGTSQSYEQGGQPTELSGEHAEPSSEHRLECTDSPEHANKIDQDISAVSTNDSEVTSTIEGSNLGHHERTSDLYEQSSLAPTDDSGNGSTTLAGK